MGGKGSFSLPQLKATHSVCCPTTEVNSLTLSLIRFDSLKSKELNLFELVRRSFLGNLHFQTVKEGQIA